MFWNLVCETAPTPDDAASDGRFVVHRHTDAQGPHLDVRIESNGCLMGWRVDATTLDGAAIATEKQPHPLHWLDHPGDAVCEDAGLYRWEHRAPDNVVVTLRGREQNRRLELTRDPGLPPDVQRSICETLTAAGAVATNAARLIADGLTARRRTIERFCGLGRELDGSAFDEALWRKTLSALSLDEVHTQLRAYEVRFDRAHPPRPVSQPEPLPEWQSGNRADAAMAILRG